jgi:uncharacterized repeat protein (TIGR01451 family)
VVCVRGPVLLRRRSVPLAALVASLVTLFGVSVASAATIGQTFAPGSSCSNQMVLQAGTGHAPGYAVPAAGGVITSWSTHAGSPGGDLQLFVFHPDGSGGYVVVGKSADMTLAASSLNTFAIRIPVGAGDLLGVRTVGSAICVSFSGDGNDMLADKTGTADLAVGSTFTPASPTPNGRVNASAVVEADADGDGFGDETQDQCPTDPTTQTACSADVSVSAAASAPNVTLGDLVTFTATVKNNSAYNAANGVSVSDPLSPGLTLVSASGGTCTSATCSVGNISKGASATVTFVARATRAGLQSDIVSAASQTPDPNSANNSAQAAIAVLAPFGGLELSSHAVKPDKHGRVKLIVRCPAASLGNCVGTDTLATARKVTLRVVAAAKKKAKPLTLGKGSFSIAAGKKGTATIKLSKPALKYLAKKHTIKAKQTIVAHDSRGVATTTVGTIKLKRR